MTSKQKDLTKNFFALGLMFWLYERSMEPTIHWIDQKFGGPPGRRRGEQARAQGRLRLRRDDRGVPHPLPGPARPSSTRASTGTSPATRRRRSASWPPRGWPTAQLFYGSYPITPASDILHQLSGYKAFGVKTFQAEDEIAAIGAAIGASYGGALALTASSGPGHRAQDRRRWASPSWSSCRSSSSTSSAPARRPGCRPRTSRRTCSR